MLAKPPRDIRGQIEQAIIILRQGGVVAFPTDTVYGLGASAAIPHAVERIYRIKGRPRSMALPLLLAHTEDIARLARFIPPMAECLIRGFLPGGLTLVLPKSVGVSDVVTAGGDTVAVRVPAHPVPVALAEGVGPIVGTSANLSGKPSALTAEEVHAQLGDRVDFTIDGGRCPGGKESTVVDVTGERPVILREGAISREEIQRVCE
ncbi:MAG: L-threonylcarbamoyladenylate synthase [Chloroflexota bacterium]